MLPDLMLRFQLSSIGVISDIEMEFHLTGKG